MIRPIPRSLALSLVALLVSLCATAPAAACTGVVIAKDGHVLVGGNEDWVRFDSFYWADAATEDAYGVVYLGYKIRGEWGHRNDFWYEFHGINDQRLFFDSFGAPCVIPTTTVGNPYRGEHLMADAMRSCATVEEAVAVFESSNLTFMQCQQFLFVDRHGHAAIVEGDETVWMDGETFAVTNFYLSNPSLGGSPCWRYDTVTSMMEADASPTLERIAELLEATSHVGTRYSVICDLTEDVLHVSYAGDFDGIAAIDLVPLFAEGSDRVSVLSLFGP